MERFLTEKFQETDILLTEKFQEADRQFKETDKKINKTAGIITTLWDKFIESLVEGDLLRLLQEKGISVHDISQRYKGSYENKNFEFDIIDHNNT